MALWAWALEVKSGTISDVDIPQGNVLNMTQAVLLATKDSSDQRFTVSVITASVTDEKLEYPICALRPKTQENLAIQQIFAWNTTVKLKLTGGPGSVWVSGYIQPHPGDEQSEDDDEEGNIMDLMMHGDSDEDSDEDGDYEGSEEEDVPKKKSRSFDADEDDVNLLMQKPAHAEDDEDEDGDSEERMDDEDDDDDDDEEATAPPPIVKAATGAQVKSVQGRNGVAKGGQASQKHPGSQSKPIAKAHGAQGGKGGPAQESKQLPKASSGQPQGGASQEGGAGSGKKKNKRKRKSKAGGNLTEPL